MVLPHLIIWDGQATLWGRAGSILVNDSSSRAVKVSKWKSFSLFDSLQPMDCSLPGSTVHGILQARILEWVAIPFSRGYSQPKDQTQVSQIAGRFFTIWSTREAQEYWSGQPIPAPGHLCDPGVNLGSPALQVDSLPAELPGKASRARIAQIWWSPDSHMSLSGSVPLNA